MSAVFEHFDTGTGKSVQLWYEDDRVALNTTQPTSGGRGTYHELMLPLGAVAGMAEALTRMAATIEARINNDLTNTLEGEIP